MAIYASTPSGHVTSKQQGRQAAAPLPHRFQHYGANTQAVVQFASSTYVPAPGERYADFQFDDKVANIDAFGVLAASLGAESLTLASIVARGSGPALMLWAAVSVAILLHRRLRCWRRAAQCPQNLLSPTGRCASSTRRICGALFRMRAMSWPWRCTPVLASMSFMRLRSVLRLRPRRVQH